MVINMARTASIALSITGKDTSNVTANSNIAEFVEMIRERSTDVLDSFNIQIPNGTAATNIKSLAAVLANVTNVNYVLLMTYNAAETVTPKVQIVVDAVNTVANDIASGMYTTSLTIATTSLTYPVQVQGFFYEAY